MLEAFAVEATCANCTAWALHAGTTGLWKGSQGFSKSDVKSVWDAAVQATMNTAKEPGRADVAPARFPSCELRKQGSTHSSGKGVRAASSGEASLRPVKRARRCVQLRLLLLAPSSAHGRTKLAPAATRPAHASALLLTLHTPMAHRDAETRVWEWLDVTVAGGPGAAAAATASPATAEVTFLAGLHLSEGSAGTTAVTAALDTPPCEAVEPCVSSLPDERNATGAAPGPGRDEAGCVSSRLAPPSAEAAVPGESALVESTGTACVRPGRAVQARPAAPLTLAGAPTAGLPHRGWARMHAGMRRHAREKLVTRTCGRCVWQGLARGGGLRKLGSWQELLPPPRADDGSSGSLPGLREWRAQELGVRRSTSLGDAGSTHGTEQPPPPLQHAPPEPAPAPLRKQPSGLRKRKLHWDGQEEEQPGAQSEPAAAVQGRPDSGDPAAAGLTHAPAGVM